MRLPVQASPVGNGATQFQANALMPSINIGCIASCVGSSVLSILPCIKCGTNPVCWVTCVGKNVPGAAACIQGCF